MRRNDSLNEIDLATFGQLFFNNGHLNGIQVVPAARVVESTQGDPYIDYANHYYDNFIFANDQSIYISPQKNLLILRFGDSYGKFGGRAGVGRYVLCVCSNID